MSNVTPIYPDFPLLAKEQIEVKVKQVTEKGAVALIYKTARTDMDLLDQTVGPLNWQVGYRDIDGVMYCALSIRNPDTGEWISKEDCGIESRSDGEGTEKKGEASDAFKRAGFRWGIGRELYSAPFTFLKVETKQNPRGNGYVLADKFLSFDVSHIAYDNARHISELTIVDSKGNIVFNMKSKAPAKPAAKSAATQMPYAPQSVITAVVEPEAAVTEVSQEMVSSVIETYTSGKSNAEKRVAAAEIKNILGNTNYKDVDNPELRLKLYNRFKELSA